ncbi:hypothetical protein NW767_011069 [Fusarium falciforme]|nr:hypothetical protein NW767_011069 [Fusarium falciforme]
MGDVYANALVTLAAECSSSVNEGFIQSTDELARLSTQPQNRFKTTMPQGKHRQVLLQARALPQYDHRETPPSTWSTRGWTLQERMLSTRLISFGYELKYMCQEALFNESCFLKERTNTALDGHKTLRAPKSQKDVFNLWQGIVEDYSRRSLTDCRDKLPAISGVAKVIHQNTSSVYLAGVWKSNIGRDLLWYSPAPAKDSITPSEVYLAPSFSWASISRPVYHDHHINAEENEWVQVVEILDCKVELVGPDHFGQVKSGYLTLSAPRIPTTIYPSLKSPGSINDFYAKPRWSIGVPEDLGVSELGDNVYGDFLYLDAAVQTIDTTNDDGEVETAACRLYEEEKAKDYLSSLDLQKHDTQHTSINTTPSTSASCWLLYIGVFVGETASTYEFLVLGKSPKRSHAYERLGMWSMPIEQNTSSVFKDKFHHMIQSAQTVEVTIV